ncbi:MAG TPA: butyrate kinase [Candidatus Limnocylindria bacterium]|nr:butyrate kinase [Candidatus Limnocylindria bacterium]
MKTLVLNLGSTSTKAGVFEDGKPLAVRTIRHDPHTFSAYATLMDQKDERKRSAEEWFLGEGYSFRDLDVIAARGGMVRPVPGGIYLVDDAAAGDAASGRYGDHASNLGLVIAREWSAEHGVPAIFADPPTTDEMTDVARVTGVRGAPRRSVFHALNCKRAVRGWCGASGADPLTGRFVVAHMGGGITVAAVDGLRVADVTNGIDGEGPFTPERSGALSVKAVLGLLEASGGDGASLYKRLYTRGGLMSWFGTTDVGALEKRAQDEPEVRLVLDAMVYNVAKHIGAMAAALDGRVDRVLLTGGIAHNAPMMERLIAKVSFIAGCSVLPGEDELGALADAARRYALGLEEAKSVAG